MDVRIALLRGVNVGGANRLPMAEFRSLLADLGYLQPETYIQSGNAVFQTDAAPDHVARALSEAVAARFGFSTPVIVLSPDALATALDHPFGPADGKTVHAVFLANPDARPDTTRLARLLAPYEAWDFHPGLFRLFTPEGFGRSKLAAELDRVLPGPLTARNLNTVAALLAMAKGRIAHP